MRTAARCRLALSEVQIASETPAGEQILLYCAGCAALKLRIRSRQSCKMWGKQSAAYGGPDMEESPTGWSGLPLCCRNK